MLTFFEWWCIITFVSCESNRQGTRRWRNRQTRRLQVPVVATSCGFKSHSPHRSPVSVDTGFFYVLSKADIRNPSLQLCWQGLASLLAHERSRFAICQWELSTPTGISIPPHPPLSAPRTWSGGMLICVQMFAELWELLRSEAIHRHRLAQKRPHTANAVRSLLIFCYLSWIVIVQSQAKFHKTGGKCLHF